MKKLVGFLVAATAACGNDGVHHLPDGPPQPIDAASNIDAPAQPVTLTVMSNGVAQANVAVYFQGADSSVISTTTTDATGVASALMPHGGYVTAVDPFPINNGSAATGNHALRTFADVKSGDHLKLDDSVTVTTQISVTVNLPVDAATTNAYYVFNSCNGSYTYIPATLGGSGSGVTPTATAYLSGCGATADFMVVSLDASSQPLNYLFAPNVAVTDLGTVDLTTQTYVGATPTTFNVNNISSYFTYGNYYDLVYGTTKGLFRTDYYFNGAIGGTGNQVATVKTLGGTGVFSAEVLQMNSPYGQHYVYRWGATPAGDGSYSIDAGSALLDFSAYAAYDQPSASVLWTSHAGTTPDGYYAALYFQRPADALYWNWEVAGKYAGIASVHLPTLPGDGAAYNVGATDSTSVQDLAVFKAPISWDALRPSVFDFFDRGDPTDLVVGASGQFEIEWNSNNAGFKATGPQAHRHAKRH